MVQLENEYGSFGSDHAYVAALRDMLQTHFEVPLYTNDGGVKVDLEGGSIPGVLAETDGDQRTGFAARDQYVAASSLGPQLDSEYYVLSFDYWGSNSTHKTPAGDAASSRTILADIDWVLAHNDSISLYMFHGGTNWGFDNGGIWLDSSLHAITTSYDYGAPLDESGRPTAIYYQIRDVIAKHVPAGSIPDVPEPGNLSDIPRFQLEPVAGLFDGLGVGPTAVSPSPLPMEALNQSYGFVLYEHTAESALQGQLLPGDGPRDASSSM